MLVTLKEVLQHARRDQYAVGLFNTINTDMLEAAINAAERLRSPIIIGTAEILLPYGELSLIAPSVVAAAERASVPVVVHYDHGLTFERCLQAMQLGFTSIMYDCSQESEADNIERTLEMTRIAHGLGCSIEAEIGHIGGTEDAAADELPDADCYTSVEDAVRFVNATGVDALAVAVGTAHGSYRAKPILDFQRIADIHHAVAAPLVLHGGSGLSDEDFRRSIHSGIGKVNVFTDLCLTGVDAMTKGVSAGESFLDIRARQTAAFEREIARKITVFGSAQKA